MNLSWNPFIKHLLFESATDMELELKEEGASLYVEEYGLLDSRFHKIFNFLESSSSVDLSTQEALLSLQKEVLRGKNQEYELH